MGDNFNLKPVLSLLLSPQVFLRRKVETDTFAQVGNLNRSDFGVSLYFGSERKQVSEDCAEFPNVDEF